MVIGENRYVKQGLGGLPKIFTSDSFEGLLGENASVLPGGRYRPIPLATHAIEAELFGISKREPGAEDLFNENAAAISHIVNVLLYLIVALILFRLLSEFIFKDKPAAAFFGALIFAVHPIHTEAVANIKGRDEILSLLFLLLALLYLLRAASNHSGNSKQLVISAVCYVLALFSKENGVTFLAIFPLALYCFSNQKARNIAAYTGLFALIFLVYFGIRSAAVSADFFEAAGESLDVLNDPYVNATAAEKYATIILVLGRYLTLLLFPHPLSYDYSYKQIDYYTFADPGVLTSLVIHILLAAVALLQLKQKSVAAFAILFYIISISIVSNIVINLGAFMGERLLFQSSVGFAIAAGLAINALLERLKPLRQQQTVLIGVSAVLVVLAGFKVTGRNPDWKDNPTLFLTDVAKVPNSAKAQKAAGEAYGTLAAATASKDSANYYRKKALVHFDKALEIHPEFVDALLDKGTAYFHLEQYDSTEAAWNAAAEIEPNHPILKGHYQILSQIYERKGSESYQNQNADDQTVAFLNKAVRYNPANHRSWYLLGITYGRMASLGALPNYDKAINAFQKAVQIDPSNAEYWYNLGGVAYQGGRYEEAEKALRKTLELAPNHPKAGQALNAAIQMQQRQ